MTLTTERLYTAFETTVESWQEFQSAVNELTDAYPSDSFVWRGQGDAAWGVHSSLSRALAGLHSRPPTEDELVDAERRLLQLARIDWRMDGIPALQLFAQLQHVGAPTRLLDVTFNPLVAAWFAVTSNPDTDGRDGRIFAFASGEGALQLSTRWNGNRPPWHDLASDADRRRVRWGTGLGRRVWRPPALHGRIPAQNAAFLLDGSPIDVPEGHAPGVRAERVTAEEFREFASLPLRLSGIRQGRLPRPNAPVFTFRITAAAKEAIRHQLERRYDYRYATVYADIEGLADYVRCWPAAALLPS